MAGGEDLRDQVANLRADHAALGQRVTGIEHQIGGLRSDLEDKHKQNRVSIHELRGMAQDTMDQIHEMALSMTAFISEAKGSGGVKSRIFQGIWLLVGGGLVAFIGELIKKAMHS